MWAADLAQSHAVLPAFLLGIAVADAFKRHPEERRRFRVVSFAFLTPIFFLKGGLNVDVGQLAVGAWLLIAFLVVKIATKVLGVLPAALRYVRPHAVFTTLLMSTGLTFGTISSLYGLNAGIIDRQQFTILIGAVIGSAIIPTIIAQRWFAPPVQIGRILRHLGVPTEIPTPRPARAPPSAWEFALWMVGTTILRCSTPVPDVPE